MSRRKAGAGSAGAARAAAWNSASCWRKPLRARSAINSSNEITIYPNPSINKEVNVSNTKAADEFILFDLSGKLLSPVEKIYNESTGITLLKLPQTITSGIYILKVNARAKLLFVKE